ncbi:MAG: SMP-30/gluconolactonase/LRE family protein [Hoeflea sp.]|uniref:SMP-30/gluconolactonase/LRE family protein n=1 Tax=Hoeflea sp. TaxID=1940281 RepID=UPI0032EE998F
MAGNTIPFSGTTVEAPACMLGEGPTFDPHTGTAWWFDILGKILFEHVLVTGAIRQHPLPAMGSVLARVDADRQIVATEAGLYLRQTGTGAMELVTPIEADAAATRSNDGRVHQSGALWFGTMGKNAENGAGTIYHVARGTVTKLYPGISIPNAICFSPDGAIAYFTDTAVNKLMQVAVDPATGLPTGEPEVLVDHSGGDGGIDGAVCDTDGVIWNARWGAGCVDAYSPSGEHLLSLEVPASKSTCPAFVGADAGRLLVTSAKEGMSQEQLERNPEAGNTFILNHPVKGRFEPDYLL